MGLSLLIPTYEQRGHGGAMLLQLLASIQRLRVPAADFEILVTDNSEDNTIRAICAKYPLKVPITYLHNNKHKGAAENINYALDHAKHDKIKIMCQDDLFLTPSALTAMDDALDRKGWVISYSRIIKDSGAMGRTAAAKFIPGIMDKNTVGMPSCIAFRKTAARLDPSLKTFCDLWFYHELFFDFGMPAVIATALVGQRYWSGSQSRNQPPTHAHDALIMKKRYYDKLHTTREMPGLRQQTQYPIPGPWYDAPIQ